MKSACTPLAKRILFQDDNSNVDVIVRHSSINVPVSALSGKSTQTSVVAAPTRPGHRSFSSGNASTLSDKLTLDKKEKGPRKENKSKIKARSCKVEMNGLMGFVASEEKKKETSKSDFQSCYLGKCQPSLQIQVSMTDSLVRLVEKQENESKSRSKPRKRKITPVKSSMLNMNSKPSKRGLMGFISSDVCQEHSSGRDTSRQPSRTVAGEAASIPTYSPDSSDSAETKGKVSTRKCGRDSVNLTIDNRNMARFAPWDSIPMEIVIADTQQQKPRQKRTYNRCGLMSLETKAAERQRQDSFGGKKKRKMCKPLSVLMSLENKQEGSRTGCKPSNSLRHATMQAAKIKSALVCTTKGQNQRPPRPSKGNHQKRRILEESSSDLASGRPSLAQSHVSLCVEPAPTQESSMVSQENIHGVSKPLRAATPFSATDSLSALSGTTMTKTAATRSGRGGNKAQSENDDQQLKPADLLEQLKSVCPSTIKKPGRSSWGSNMTPGGSELLSNRPLYQDEVAWDGTDDILELYELLDCRDATPC